MVSVDSLRRAYPDSESRLLDHGPFIPVRCEWSPIRSKRTRRDGRKKGMNNNQKCPGQNRYILPDPDRSPASWKRRPTVTAGNQKFF